LQLTSVFTPIISSSLLNAFHSYHTQFIHASIAGTMSPLHHFLFFSAHINSLQNLRKNAMDLHSTAFVCSSEIVN
jgi:hypothetical protein